MASPQLQDSCLSVKETVQKYLHDHPDTSYVNREVFYPAYHQHNIKQLLNCDVLYPPLLAIRDLVESEEDRKRFTSSFQQPHDKHNTLIDLIERGGEYGCMLLYIYICETATTPGHSEAARILTEVAAQQKQIPPPSLQHKSKSTSSNSSIEEEPQSNYNCAPSSNTHSGKADEVIPNKSLAELAMKITEWEVLAPQLELTEEDAVEIKADHQGFYNQQKIGCLRKWKNQNGHRATYRNLMNAARACDQTRLIDHLTKLPEVGVELQKDISPKAHLAKLPASRQSSTGVKVEMDSDVKMDLDNILEGNIEEIIEKYAVYVNCILAITKEKGVSPEDLRSFLLTLSAFSNTFKGQNLALLSDKKSELEEKKTINEIFDVLSTGCASFMNYSVFQAIMKKFNIPEDREELKYCDHLKAYCLKHTISEFTIMNPLLKKKEGSKPFILKFDIEMTCRLAKVDELKRVVAKILGLKSSALDIVDIEEGCVVVTFLISSSVADILFTPNTVFTPQQEKELRDNSVLWLKCNGYVYKFGTVENPAPILTLPQPKSLSPSLPLKGSICGKEDFPPTSLFEDQSKATEYPISTESGKSSFFWSVEEIVHEYIRDHPEANFVNKEVFHSANQHKIRHLLNCDILYPHLLAHLVESGEDRKRFASSFKQPHGQHSTLIELIERGEEYGYMLLYIYICKTVTTPGASGHSEAARILTEAAQQKQIPLPESRKQYSDTSSISSGYGSEVGIHMDELIKTEIDRLSRKFNRKQYSDTSSISSGYGSEVGIHMDELIKTEIDRLSRKFNDLDVLLFNHLEEEEIRVEEIKNLLSVLPLHFIDELSVSRIRNTKHLLDLFAVLNERHVWNFIDYHLQHHIIAKYGNSTLHKKAKEFIDELERFEETTTVADFMNFWPGEKTLPINYDAVTLLQNYTLKELSRARKALCEEFPPPVVMLLSRIGSDSPRVTYPSKLTEMLQEILESHTNTQSLDILKSLDISRRSSARISLSPSAVSEDSTSTCSTSTGLSTPLSLQSLEGSLCSNKLFDRLMDLQDSAISVEFGRHQVRDKRQRTDGGCYPSIALNNHGTIVEVKHQTGTNLMFYRVGRRKDDVIAWGNPSSPKPPRKKYFSSGAYPRVTLNDMNRVVEIHKGDILDRCCYRVGRVDPTTAKIAWGNSTHLNVGLHPDIAINNNNNVVAVFRENVITKYLSYRVGQLLTVTNEIMWIGRKTRIAGIKAEVLSIDINDNGLVILSYQVPITNRIHYVLGKLSMPISAGQRAITWSKIVRMCNGFTPSVSINNNDQVVQIHQSLARRHLISNVGVAWWGDDFKDIEWSSLNGTSNRHYGKGIFPSVAIDDSGHVVEAHEPRISLSKNRLYYLLGKIVHTRV